MKIDRGPLVSFCVFSYNQKNLILESLESALNQSYENIEFIFSDDNSTDGTFEVIEDFLVKNKSNKNIKAVKNNVNLGMALHIDKVVRNICKGSLIFIQAGDDISYTNRVELVVENWITSNKKAFCLSSNSVEMEFNGTVCSENKNESKKELNLRDFVKYYDGDIGATFAFKPEVITEFSPMQTGNYEDKCLAFRAKLLGGYQRIDAVLLYHRKSGISDFKSSEIRKNTILKVRPIILEQMENDLNEKVIQEIYTKNELLNIKKILRKHKNFYLLMEVYVKSHGIKKIIYMTKIFMNGDFYRIRLWRNTIMNVFFNRSN